MRTNSVILAFIILATYYSIQAYSDTLPNSDISKSTNDEKKVMPTKLDSLKNIIDGAGSKEADPKDNSSSVSSSANSGILKAEVKMAEVQVHMPEKNEDNFKIWAQLVAQVAAALTALYAVVLGPKITMRVSTAQSETAFKTATLQSDTALKTATLQSDTAKENSKSQVKANVLSKSIQDWINSLRDEISKFNTYSISLRMIAIRGDEISKRTEKILDMFHALILHQTKIILMIDAEAPACAQLIKVMDEIVANISDDKFDFSNAENTLQNISREILSTEWDRLKALLNA